jgi:predicted secreted protein
MSLSMAVFTFINAWWIMLFFVMPFGVKTAESRNEHEYAAAPKAINWKKMLAINTVLALLATGGLAWLIHSGLIQLPVL